MGEPHPGQATASDCQLLTEQPGKDLQTMGQQFFVIRRMPTRGSPAAKALAERRAAKGLPALPVPGGKKAAGLNAAAAPAAKANGQRQPHRKNRKKSNQSTGDTQEQP